MRSYQGDAFQGQTPCLHENSYLAEGVRAIGAITLGEYSSIWYNCSLRADEDAITIGRYSNIQDGSVLHLDPGYPCTIGDYVTIGHNVVLHGCTIEDYCLIGMKSVVLNGAVIGKGSVVAAGTVVGTGMIVPPFSFVTGIPGKIEKTLNERTLELRRKQAVGYKTLWCERYGVFQENTGEKLDF